MPDAVRPYGQVMAEAVQAAQYGIAPPTEVVDAIVRGEPVSFDALGFDSLAMMEFCISVELQTGHALTPEMMNGFGSVVDVARWLAARQGSG